MDIKEQLKDIKTQLRLSMNGAVSQSNSISESKSPA